MLLAQASELMAMGIGLHLAQLMDQMDKILRGQLAILLPAESSGWNAVVRR